MLRMLKGKGYVCVLGTILLIGCIIFRNFLFADKVYFFIGVGSDTLNYFYPYLSSVSDYIRKNVIPGWSFNAGMGQNMFPFCLRDPFDVFIYIAGKDHIFRAMVYKEFAKILFGGLIFYRYLRLLRLSEYTSFIGSLLFSFSGFMIVGGIWYIFSFEAFNLALLLLSFELLLSKNRWYLFPLPVFLFAISQPFNLYLYGVFLAGYAILRLFQTNGFTPGNLGKLYIKMFGLALIGILCGAPFFIENIVQLLESPRGSGVNSYFHTLSSAPVFASIDKMQAGTDILRLFSNDLVGNGCYFNGSMNYLEAPAFYCGLPCLLLMPQAFWLLSRRMKIVFAAIFLVLALSIIFPYFRHALWLFAGDYYRGFSFFIMFFFLFSSLYALELIAATGKLNLLTLVITVVILFAFLYRPYFPARELLNFPEHPIPDAGLLTFVSVMLVIYSVVLYLMGNGIGYLKLPFLLLLVFELGYLSNITVNNIRAASISDLKEKKAYNDYTVDALRYINSIDSSFYRVDKTYSSSPVPYGSLNDGLAQGYRGTSSYNQSNQLSYIHYLQLLGILHKESEIDSRWAVGLVGRPVLEAQNQVKYVLTKTPIDSLHRIYFDSLGRFGNVTLLRNRYALPFGYTYSYFIRASVFDVLSNDQKDQVSMRACIVNDSDVTKCTSLIEFQLRDTVSVASFTPEQYRSLTNELSLETLSMHVVEDNRLYGTVTVSGDKMMYLSVPYDKGWPLKVDGLPTYKIILSGGMTGVLVKKGSHSIETYYKLRFIKLGVVMSLLGIVVYLIMVFVRVNSTKTMR